MANWFFWLFIIGVIAVSVCSFFWLNLFKKTEQWNIASGRITKSEIKEIRENEGNVYYLNLEYHYFVDGKEYVGKNISPEFGFVDKIIVPLIKSIKKDGFSANAFRRYLDAKEKQKQFPAGKEVSVYYNPNDPEQSSLVSIVSISENRNKIYFLLLGVLLFVVLLMVAGLLFFRRWGL
jgi:hypothetical protein